MVIIANPIADSVAAIVKINIIKIWPMISSKYTEKIAKFKLTDKSKSSIDIITINMFLRFSTIPSNPIKNKAEVKFKKKLMFIVVNIARYTGT